METYGRTQNFTPRLWIAVGATIIAFLASLLASLNLYLLEDSNPLAQAAYSASPVLRLSFDGAYISALAAGVAICAIVVYAGVQANTPAVISLTIIALLVAFAGFGGLLILHPETFLALFLVFMGLALISILSGRALASGLHHRFGQRLAAILGACAGAGIALLVNGVSVIAHTLSLNPVSHSLYMQGQIGGTHYNSLLVFMGVELLTMIIYALSIVFTLRSPARTL